MAPAAARVQKRLNSLQKIKHDIGLEAVAHLTCVGHTQSEALRFRVARIAKATASKMSLHFAAIRRKVVRRSLRPTMVFPTPANWFGSSKRTFHFASGAWDIPRKHIEAPTMEEDLRHLEEKIHAGRGRHVTQLFFDNADYFSFVDALRKRGIKNTRDRRRIADHGYRANQAIRRYVRRGASDGIAAKA